MPERLFYELDIAKKALIFDAGLNEFSQHPYDTASTNRIIKFAGISKGSLFKYFKNKEDLYFFILDSVIADLVAETTTDMSNLKGDLFELVIGYAAIEFNWHIRNPEKYQLIKRAFIDDHSPIFKKTINRYNASAESLYDSLLSDHLTNGLNSQKDIKIIKWVIEGFNQEFNQKIDSFDDVSVLKDVYLEELIHYLNIVKNGIAN